MIRVPRLIHLVWIGSRPNPLPGHVEQWRALHPEWKIRVWTDADRPHLGAAEEAYRKVPHASGKVNLLRLWLLAEFGGVYSDMDSVPLAPIDGIADGLTLATMTGRNGHPHNGTMLATPGHPALAELVGGAAAHYERLRRRGRVPIWEVYGTRYIRRVLPHYADFHQWPKALVCRHKFETPDTVVIHTDLNSWRGETVRRKVVLR